MLYRFEFSDTHQGIIRGLDRVFNPDNIDANFINSDLSYAFDRYLPVPTCFNYDNWKNGSLFTFCPSYFTEDGYEMFKEYIDIIVDEAKYLGLPIACVSITEEKMLKEWEVLYRDNYQVVFMKKWDK